MEKRASVNHSAIAVVFLLCFSGLLTNFLASSQTVYFTCANSRYYSISESVPDLSSCNPQFSRATFKSKEEYDCFRDTIASGSVPLSPTSYYEAGGQFNFNFAFWNQNFCGPDPINSDNVVTCTDIIAQGPFSAPTYYQQFRPLLSPLTGGSTNLKFRPIDAIPTAYYANNFNAIPLFASDGLCSLSSFFFVLTFHLRSVPSSSSSFFFSRSCFVSDKAKQNNKKCTRHVSLPFHLQWTSKQ